MNSAIVTILSSFIIWNLLAGLVGFIRAHYEDYLYFQDRNHPNLHGWYLLIRGIILLPFAFSVFEELSIAIEDKFLWWMFSIFFYAAGIMSYSFFYLGILYIYRNKLAPEIYKKRFFSSKEKGEDKNSAKMQLGFWLRFAFFFNYSLEDKWSSI